MQRFEGKKAIITGGSLGLGRAIAERFTSEGADVMITGRDSERLNVAAEEITALGGGQAVALAGDVADHDVPREICSTAMERFGRIDVLVNNAGIYDEVGYPDQNRENWDYVIGVLLTGPYFLAQEVGKVMIDQGSGSIINIASIDGHEADGPFPAYGAAKAGLINVTKYMAVVLGPHGVRANSISPGWVDTPMVASLGELYDRLKADFQRVPLKRLITPEEIAAAAAFLASDESSAITGADHLVDAGTLADAYVIPTTEA